MHLSPARAALSCLANEGLELTPHGSSGVQKPKFRLYSKSMSACVVLSSLHAGAWLLWPFAESIAEHMKKPPLLFVVVTVHGRSVFIKAVVLASDICIVLSVMTWPRNSSEPRNSDCWDSAVLPPSEVC